MGSWNKTCGLSNLHIKHGDEAYVFLLEPETIRDSRCYATHMFRPLLLPFVTEYNDYGGGENSSGPALPFIMEAIKRQLHEMEVGKNEYHDIAVKKDAFNEELFFEAVHEGRLYKENRWAKDKDDLDEHTKLEYVMFRKDVVDYILENRVIEQYVGDGKGTCGYNNNYIQYKFADIVADILPLIQEMCEKIAAMDEHTRDFVRFGGLDSFFKYNSPNHAARWLRGDESRYSRLVDMRDIISHVLDNPTTEKVLKLEAILTEHLKAKFIDAFMEMTRKSWYPAGHEGSQAQGHSGYRLLNRAIDTVLDAEKKQFEEDTGEEFVDYD